MKIWISIALFALACFFQEGDATVSAWTEPVIGTASGAGAYSFAENIATGTGGVAKTVAATGQGAITYTLLTTGTPFSIASSTGVLSLDTALDFETTATYTIEIRAVDTTTPTSGTATITVTVTDVNEAPTFTATAFGVCIADASAAGATLTTVTATDQDSGDTITYSIAGGNTNTDFSVGASTGVITVATGKTLAASTTAAYALQVEAADNDGTPLTGTTTVGVLVQTCSSGSAALLAGTVMVLMTSFIMLLK